MQDQSRGRAHAYFLDVEEVSGVRYGLYQRAVGELQNSQVLEAGAGQICQLWVFR